MAKKKLNIFGMLARAMLAFLIVATAYFLVKAYTYINDDIAAHERPCEAFCISKDLEYVRYESGNGCICNACEDFSFEDLEHGYCILKRFDMLWK